jgi:hypothetical protein
MGWLSKLHSRHWAGRVGKVAVSLGGKRAGGGGCRAVGVVPRQLLREFGHVGEGFKQRKLLFQGHEIDESEGVRIN